jgi:hypothetical protein
MDDADNIAQAKQARLVAVVLVCAMVLWMGAQWLGGAVGLPTRFVFLFDLAALAAFFWALVVTFQLWRKRRDSRDEM